MKPTNSHSSQYSTGRSALKRDRSNSPLRPKRRFSVRSTNAFRASVRGLSSLHCEADMNSMRLRIFGMVIEWLLAETEKMKKCCAHLTHRGVLILSGIMMTWARPALAAAPSEHGSGSVVVPKAESHLPHDRYVFQHFGGGVPSSVSLAYELGYGTRETRFFGNKGVEQGVRARWNVTSWLTMEGYGGLLLAPAEPARPGGSVMALARPLNQARFGVDLHLGAGYAYDFRGDHVLRFMLGLGRRFGRVRTTISSLIEVPLTGDRDAADLMVAASAMVPLTDWYAQGVEFGAEDIEGLWDPEESEGGARFLLGPTALFHAWKGLVVRLNASLVYAYVANRFVARTPPFGISAKMSVGYSF